MRKTQDAIAGFQDGRDQEPRNGSASKIWKKQERRFAHRASRKN